MKSCVVLFAVDFLVKVTDEEDLEKTIRIDMVGKGPPQHLDFTSIIAYLTEKL